MLGPPTIIDVLADLAESITSTQNTNFVQWLKPRLYVERPMANHHKDGEDASELLTGIASMVMDRATSMLRVIMTDGTAMSRPFDPSTFPTSSIIVRSRYIPRTNLLFMETNRGDTIEAEMPTLHNQASIAGRPVVYLDQRDWSFLAKVLAEPERVDPDQPLAAATYLIDLARAQKIILPMSFAHLSETSWRRDTDRRYHLALALTRLSRGWQMRYPVDVWRYELHQTFSARFQQVALPPLDVFTLAACAAEPQDTFQELNISSAGFPEGIEYVGRAMVCMTSYIDAVLFSESSLRTPIPEWVETFQLITNEVAKVPTILKKREILRVMLLKDLKLQVVGETAHKYGGTPAEMEQWVESHFDADVRTMRCFGFWSDIYRVKHLNSQTIWRANDLIDMLFLTCAAGYADYVIGERSTTSHLKQAAKRLGRSIKAYSQMDDLVVALQDDGL